MGCEYNIGRGREGVVCSRRVLMYAGCAAIIECVGDVVFDWASFFSVIGFCILIDFEIERFSWRFIVVFESNVLFVHTLP